MIITTKDVFSSALHGKLEAWPPRTIPNINTMKTADFERLTALSEALRAAIPGFAQHLRTIEAILGEDKLGLAVALPAVDALSAASSAFAQLNTECNRVLMCETFRRLEQEQSAQNENLEKC